MMPFYNFQCKNKKCGEVYDDLVPYDATGKYPDVRCPYCNSKKKDQCISVCNFQFAQPEGTDRWTSEAKGHDYRFKHNLPKVLEERKQAEIKSKKGATPYRPIDDISSGRHFGPVE